MKQTKTMVFGQPTQPNNQLKPIEFVKSVSSLSARIKNAHYNPAAWDNVVLLIKETYDVMYAYDDHSLNGGVVYLGHWNDGIVSSQEARRVTLEDIKPGLKVYVSSHIHKYVDEFTITSCPFQKSVGPFVETDKRLERFLEDMGVIPNDYNDWRTFFTYEDAENWMNSGK